MPIINADLSVTETDREFMIGQLEGLTTRKIVRKVSEWAEENRYLPPELTNIPGRFKCSVTPYMTEIMDALSPNHPARKVVVMKGAQIGATTAVLENFIGFTIDEDPSGMIYVSADAGLTRMGIELKVDRMLHHSGLSHLLSAPDGRSKRSGDTAQMKEFPGGFLLAVGARNPGKLRSIAVKKAVLDELDGMKLTVGGVGQEEGSPVALIEKRTDTYLTTRKILYISTPLKLQTSLIHPLYLAGDQRQYEIPCIHCGEFQPLKWHGVTEGGKGYGIVFDLDDHGILVEESVGYCCRLCSAVFYNHDKSWFLPRGVWKPTSTSDEIGLTSYHVPAFLSPPGLYSWTGSVYKWLKAWNVGADRLRDIDEYQTFRNLEQGLPFEERGESPSAERVRVHRRLIYSEGEIPNVKAVEETGAPVLLLTCAVDVHSDRLDVEILAWCQDRQTYSVEWLHLRGDPDAAPSEGCWAELSTLIEETEWIADDGRVYRVIGTLIDVGWAEKADAVYEYCQQFSGGVYPCMGRDMPIKGALMKEFSQSESQLGLTLFNVTASLYKNRLAAWLKADWNEGQLQPLGYPNYPVDRRDDYFKQYEAEEKVQILDRITKRPKGWKWQQIGQRPNHAFDCRVYGMAAFDMIVLDFCVDGLGLEKLSYADFFNAATPKKNSAGSWVSTPFSYHPEEVPG